MPKQVIRGHTPRWTERSVSRVIEGVRNTFGQQQMLNHPAFEQITWRSIRQKRYDMVGWREVYAVDEGLAAIVGLTMPVIKDISKSTRSRELLAGYLDEKNKIHVARVTRLGRMVVERGATNYDLYAAAFPIPAQTIGVYTMGAINPLDLLQTPLPRDVRILGPVPIEDVGQDGGPLANVPLFNPPSI